MESVATKAVPGPGRSGSSYASSTLAKANDRLAISLFVLVALSPIPLASNRPFFWAAGAVLLGLVGLLYFAFGVRGQRMRIPLTYVAGLATPFCLLCLYLVIQVLPLGRWLPLGFVDANGNPLMARSLSLAPGNTWLMFLQFSGYGMLFLLTLQFAANRRRAMLVLRAVYFTIVAYAVYALVQTALLGDSILGAPKWAYFQSATGTFVNRNSFATFLAFGLVTGVALLVQDIGHARRHEVKGLTRFVLFGMSLLVLGVALLATGSRMGSTAGALGCLFVLLVSGLRSGLRLRGLLLRVLLAFVVLVALYAVFGVSVLDRVGDVASSADLRGELYRQVISMIETRPWLGFGGGSFEYGFSLFQQLPLNSDLVWDKAHSTYLALWAELGLVAGSVPLLIVFAIFVRLTARLFESDREVAPYAAAGGVIVTAAIHSLVDFSLEVQSVAYVFIMILAIGTARALQPAQSRPEGEAANIVIRSSPRRRPRHAIGDKESTETPSMSVLPA